MIRSLIGLFRPRPLTDAEAHRVRRFLAGFAPAGGLVCDGDPLLFRHGAECSLALDRGLIAETGGVGYFLTDKGKAFA